MHPLAVLGLILLFIIGANSSGDDNQCPNKCTCRRTLLRDGSSYIKLRCGDTEKITTLDEIDLLNIASEIIHFNLSGNLLTTFYPKVQMIALQKLDLSRNKLVDLQNNQFSELPNLRRLDISENNIRIIELHAFSNLHSLERLKLNQNQINSITKGTFDHLTNLKQLDISNNPLTCDCGLLWLVGWSLDVSVKLLANPKCSSPPTFRGLPIRKLKIGDDIHCRSAASISGLPIIEMTPNLNQVVFEGDSLKLHCKAPNIFDAYNASSKIEWTWFDSDPKSYFNEVTIESHFLQSTGLLDSTLRISKLKRNHTGIWSCLFVSSQGNHSKGITVVVISDDTQYCPITMTANNKGTYTWPRTVVNYTATVPCESLNLNLDVAVQKASYFCSEDGQWESLDTNGCSYVSETTKILEQFSKVNSSIIESAKHFRNYTLNRKHFSDVMDLVFAINTMENYLKYQSVGQIGGVLMDITNNLMELSKKYLRDANHLYRICTKLVTITEKLATITSTSLLHKSNIAVEIFSLKKSGFLGLTCTWYVDSQKSSERLFSCITDSQSDSSDLRGKITEAAITIPDSLFEQLRDVDPFAKLYNVLISMHSSNILFPIDVENQDRIDVRTAVVGAKLIEKPVRNLTDPVLIMLRVPGGSTSSITYIPVWWDPSLDDGNGNWTSSGCAVDHELSDHVVFTCTNFGYYGLLHETAMETQMIGAKFRYSHPAIYVGSFILFTSLLIVTVTYLMSYGSIQMPKKAKHSLINMWIAICCLVYLYVFGIFQTEDQRICQIVGMSLHYFTLSSLLWMCVNVNCMYNRLSKNDVMELQDDDLGPSDQPIKKPIAGLYFVGWGVAIIVCGISAAINIRDYASSNYCFLRPGPPLSALYIPAVILLLFFVVFCLLIRCAVYNVDANGHLSEGTQATENVDLDLLEPNFPQSSDNRSVLTMSSKTASSEVEDPEHAPSTQLKAIVIFLILYSLSWLCCALATSQPFDMFQSFEEDLFSVAYSLVATLTAAFTLFFYCVARSDVRGQWGGLSFWLKNRKPCCILRSRNVSDTARNLPQIQVHQLPVPPVGIPLIEIQSRSSSRTSSRTRSNRSATIRKGAVDLNCAATSLSDAPSNKNNVNLIVLHRQQYRNNIPNIIENPTNAAQVFYNPHQSTVARKFFRRQKRHMMKRNNLPTLRHRANSSDAGSGISDYRPQQHKDNSSVDRSMFGTNSKVNNTNIHVEKVIRRNKTHKNPNLFSDSAEEDSAGDPPLGRLVLEAERLRRRELPGKYRTRKKSNKPPETPANNDRNIMRSVSQQCTLEYSSENLSDSFLDKLSPEKVSNLEDTVPPSPQIDETPSNSEILFRDNSEAPSVVESNSIVTEDGKGKIYVNPSHEIYFRAKGSQSRASSVSVSDLDELYQQIRRGPLSGLPQSRTFVGSFRHNSPCLSDSDVTGCGGDRRSKVIEGFEEDVETSV